MAGAIFVDHSNRPFLFMIATQVLCVMPDSDLDPLDFGLSQDNDFCGSANAKFESRINLRVLPTGRKRRQSLGFGRGGSSHSDPVGLLGQRSRPGTVLVQ